MKTFLLLGLGLWAVFVEEFERLGGGVTVEGVGELGNGWWDFEAEVEDLLLALKTDVGRPLYHTGKVALRLDILTNAEVSWALLDERILEKQVSLGSEYREE